MCLMGRKAVSHPSSHKGENIKCSKNNHQHLMYMRSLSRWEGRNLSHFRLSCAWYRKLPIVCESQTDREGIRSLLLISYSVYCSEQCILFYSGVVLLDSLCQPPCTGFKAGTAGSPAAPRQTDELLHGPCPASAPSMAARRRSWELAGLPAAGFVSSVPQLEKWENAQGHLPQTVSHSSTLSCLEQA